MRVCCIASAGQTVPMIVKVQAATLKHRLMILLPCLRHAIPELLTKPAHCSAVGTATSESSSTLTHIQVKAEQICSQCAPRRKMREQLQAANDAVNLLLHEQNVKCHCSGSAANMVGCQAMALQILLAQLMVGLRPHGTCRKFLAQYCWQPCLMPRWREEISCHTLKRSSLASQAEPFNIQKGLALLRY